MNYMALTGGGEMLVEDVVWYASSSSDAGNSIIYLRNDYGSTWDGTITLRNVNAYHYTPTSGFVVSHTYTNWYFGYECAFPNLIIDGLAFYNIETGKKMTAEEKGNVALIQGAFNSDKNLHLSETNNLPEIALGEGRSALAGLDVQVQAADPVHTTNL
jgi:hypothetical protein